MLLNVCYKIYSKIVATRIKGVLNEIIHKDQCGFMANRNIAENLRKILDIMELAELEQKPIVFLSVDFLKAFDRVDYEALQKIMEWFNFGKNMRYYVSILFKEFHLFTMNNGYLSAPIVPTRGLFQGNPAAPYLFLLIIELLAIQIRNNKRIKGVEVGTEKALLIQFADDLGMMLKCEQETWNEALTVFDRFEEQSGMKINYDKSLVYRLGSCRNTNARFYSQRKLIWSDRPLQILGVMVTPNKEELIRLNIDPILEKMKTILRMWEQRNLTLMGKIQVINSLVASLLSYRLAVIPWLPEKYYKDIEEMFRKFIWSGGKPKMKYTILQGGKEDGGARLVNVRNRHKALIMQWPYKIQADKLLRELAYTTSGNEIGDLIWSANITVKDAKKLLIEKKNYWSELILEWVKQSKEPVGHEQIKNQIIWWNSNIKIESKPILYSECLAKGVEKIGDLLKEGKGEFLSHEEFENRFDINIPFTKFWGIIKAIPNNWKQAIKREEQGENYVNKYEEDSKQNKAVKMLYGRFNKNYDLCQDSWWKWKTKINLVADYEEFVRSIINISKITICTKLRSFQFKVLHSGLVTNVQLKYYGIKETNLCTQCNRNVESIQHMLFDCEMVKTLWDWVNKTLKKAVNVETVILNNIEKNAKRVENTIILIIKFFIYKQRCAGKQINVQECKQYVKEYEKTEREIAKNKNKLSQHEIKWANTNCT